MSNRSYFGAPDLLLHREEGGDGCGKDREHSPGVAVGLVLISVRLAPFGERRRRLGRRRRHGIRLFNQASQVQWELLACRDDGRREN